MRLVLVGGGGFRVPLVYRAVLARRDLGVRELVLHDVDADRLAAISRVLRPDDGVRVRLETSLAEAVRGADFVFSAIRVGGAAGRVADERRALAAGVLGQETVGAGGLAYGLRTLPTALALARTVADLAPDAWLINFTNPAGLVTEASRTVLGDRVIGICDSPVGLVRRACRALRIPQAELQAGEVVADYAGINHLGWLRALRLGGRDLLPSLLASDTALASFEEGRLFGGPLLRALGAVPNEYLYFYYRRAEVLRALAGAPTRGEVVRREQDEFYAAAAAAPAEAGELWEATRLRREESYLAEARGSGEARDASDLAGGGYQEVALDLMRALSGGPASRLIVNVANGPTLPQLPADLVVEVPCEVDAGGARPLPVAPLELHQLGLLASVRASERAVIEAVVTGSAAAALRAFALSPLVDSAGAAERLLDQLLADDPALAELLH